MSLGLCCISSYAFFFKSTERLQVTDECTGCTLCVSVCPVIDCITMVPKTIDHKVR